jgi:hypothetical protein
MHFRAAAAAESPIPRVCTRYSRGLLAAVRDCAFFRAYRLRSLSTGDLSFQERERRTRRVSSRRREISSLLEFAWREPAPADRPYARGPHGRFVRGWVSFRATN